MHLGQRFFVSYTCYFLFSLVEPPVAVGSSKWSNKKIEFVTRNIIFVRCEKKDFLIRWNNVETWHYGLYSILDGPNHPFWFNIKRLTACLIMWWPLSRRRGVNTICLHVSVASHDQPVAHPTDSKILTECLLHNKLLNILKSSWKKF